MGRLIDADELIKDDEVNLWLSNDSVRTGKTLKMFSELFIKKINEQPTVEAIPKDNVYKAIQEMIKYEHEGFINISLARLDEILKKCGVSEDVD